MKMDYVGKGLFKKKPEYLRNRIILVKDYLHKTGLSWSRSTNIQQDHLGQGLSQ